MKSNTKEFIEKAKKIHGNKYDYSKVNYVNNHTKVEIICPEHGSFFQIPNSHLASRGCPKCSGNVRKTTEQFIEEAKKAHGNKYDYSLVNYVNIHTKVKIVCPEHGIFEQGPLDHLRGVNCPKCGRINAGISKKRTTEQFIEEAKKVHGDKYDYSLVNYINSHTKVKIVCPEHGIFEQTPENHFLNKQGCAICAKRVRKTTEQFIEEAKKVHGNKYDYSKVNYVNAHTKVEIKCNICNSIFTQAPHEHLKGKGCSCSKQSHGEKEIEKFLKENDIIYSAEKIFLHCRDEKPLPFDFYLSELNIAIEYQGIQHYKPIEIWGGEKQLHLQRHHDWLKRKYCRDNNITLIAISYTEDIEEKLSALIKPRP